MEVIACFRPACTLAYHRTPTSTRRPDLPSFFKVCQRVNRFIDTLRQALICLSFFMQFAPLCCFQAPAVNYGRYDTFLTAEIAKMTVIQRKIRNNGAAKRW